MNNITELRSELASVFSGVKSGEIDKAKAEALNNTAGKIIKSLAVELAYYSLTKQQPQIPYLAAPMTVIGTGAIDPSLLSQNNPPTHTGQTA